MRLHKNSTDRTLIAHELHNQEVNNVSSLAIIWHLLGDYLAVDKLSQKGADGVMNAQKPQERRSKDAKNASMGLERGQRGQKGVKNEAKEIE